MTSWRPGTLKPSYLLCLGSEHEGTSTRCSGHLCLQHLRRCPGATAKQIYLQHPDHEMKPSQGTFLSPFAVHTSHLLIAPVSS